MNVPIVYWIAGVLWVASTVLFIFTILQSASFHGRKFWKPFRFCFLGQHNLWTLRQITPNYVKAECLNCQRVFMARKDLTHAIGWNWDLQALEGQIDRIERFQDMLATTNASQRGSMAIQDALDVIQKSGFE